MKYFYNKIEKCLDYEGNINYILRRCGSFVLADLDVYLEDGFFVDGCDNTVEVLDTYIVYSTKELLDFCKANDLHGLEMHEDDLFYENYKLLHDIYKLDENWLLVGGERDRVISPSLCDIGWLTENDYFKKL